MKGKEPGVWTAIFLGVTCILGSGWLFAPYLAAQYTGAASIFSWIIGALLSLLLALLLSEINSMYQERGLIARVLTISHHRDFGFVVAISNWLGMVITISSEATATVQYIGSAFGKAQKILFANHHLTFLGLLFVFILIGLFALANYWGIKGLAKINNSLTIFKIAIPIITATILFYLGFKSENFTAYQNTYIPYGMSKIFSAITVCGIFYAFYGFGNISSFSHELKNPKKNIPRALFGAIFICLLIYLGLQITFIGVLPTSLIKSGWHGLNFSSPLVQLLLLFNIHFWTVILYIDSAISPSSASIVYTGSATRMLTGMANDKQLPSFLNKIHPVHLISKPSLIITIGLSSIMALFFTNWQKIMMMVSVLQLITCIAIPIAFMKLRSKEPDKTRAFTVRFGPFISCLLFIFLTYLLIQASLSALITSLVLHLILFLFYSFTFYKRKLPAMINAFLSSWTIFLFMLFACIYGFLTEKGILSKPFVFASFVILSLAFYTLMIKQKEFKIKKIFKS